MSQGERKGSITTLRKWNLTAGGIDPMNDVIPASVGYGLEDALDFAMSEILRLQDRIKRLEEFARTIENDFDHDEDAHRYGTTCRVCDAEDLLKETKAKEAKP